ncbi:MAG: response regulator transcription factor [Desulfobaccales bacterium]
MHRNDCSPPLAEVLSPCPCLIVLAEDHDLFRAMVKQCLESTDGLKVIGEVEDGAALLEILQYCRPHVILMDITMPRMSGLEATRRVKELCPEIKVLILTMHRNPAYLKEALEAGADGYLLKEDTDTELIEAIRRIMAGEQYLSSHLAPAAPGRPGT